MSYMANTRQHDATLTVRVPQNVLDELRAVRDRNGIPVSYQVRRALVAWLAARKKGKK